MNHNLCNHAQQELENISKAGLLKDERIIDTAQGATIRLADGTPVLNFCANNYLGLANDPRLVKAAQDALTHWGYGMSSVRFICGTQTPHKQLEAAVSRYLCTDDTILYSSCFDANTGLFETILGPEDAIISDRLNHASIVDGVRLCKARRLLYATRNMAELEARLQEAADARIRLIATDGVFSMDGGYAPLPQICDLADKYNAALLVDDSHAVGFVGAKGRGTHEYFDVIDRIDLLTGTFGKALGGASGGYVSGRKPIIDLLRQRSRPYLFSNTLAPAVTGASLAALKLAEDADDLRQTLKERTSYFRTQMQAQGFSIPPGDHPIVPIMIGDAVLASRLAARMLADGIYVVGFSYPVVPMNEARVRVQISASHTTGMLDQAIAAFTRHYHAIKAELD